jgi:hypothetical protein
MIYKLSFLRSAAPVLGLALALMASSGCTGRAFAQPAAPVEALVFSTMPSMRATRPELAMDGDESTYYKTVYGMSEGDDYMVLFSRPIPVNSLRISTGDADGEDALTEGYIETKADASDQFQNFGYTKVASFDKNGVASANLKGGMVQAIRVRVNENRSAPSLIIKEIKVDSPVKIAHVQRGTGRCYHDLRDAPELLSWAQKCEAQIEEFWDETAAILYSPNFITPNMINIVYKAGPDVTPVAANGGGVMTINIAWCKKMPGDTGLGVHEMSHTVQSMSAYNPVWLVEGISDYIRWVAYEPQNHKPNINVATAKYSDSYRTTATFLGWLTLNYDSRIVTKLNNEIRFGTFTLNDFKVYTGKDIDTLWSEFIAAFKASPSTILTPKVAPSEVPRVLPTPKIGTSKPVDLTASFDTVGFTTDNAKFDVTSAFDGGGASFSATQIAGVETLPDIKFVLKDGEGPNTISSDGDNIKLPVGKYSTLWLLGAAVEGNQMNQELTVTYTDGTKQVFAQNFSDWYTPQRFVGESRTIRMTYRNMSDGTRDPRRFNVYKYGFNLDKTKEVASLTLPKNPMVKIMAVTVAN